MTIIRMLAKSFNFFTLFLPFSLLFNQQNKFNTKDTYYVFNHVDITISYHNGQGENWKGARLLSAKIEPSRYCTFA